MPRIVAMREFKGGDRFLIEMQYDITDSISSLRNDIDRKSCAMLPPELCNVVVDVEDTHIRSHDDMK